MRNTEALLEAITTIYTAPGNHAGWTASVEAATALVGGKAGVYLRIDREDMTTEASGIAGFTDQDARAYEGAQAARKDVRLQYLHNLLPGQVFREFEYVTDREAYDQSEWIRYQLENHGVYWCMSAHISKDTVWHDYLSINGLKARGSFSNDEKADMQTLLPHFARAAELDRLVNRLEQRFGAVLSVLDQFLVGLVILDVKGRLVVANRAARATAETSGAYTLDGGRLRLTRQRCNDEAQRLISLATATIRCEAQSDGGRVVVPKRGDAGCLLLEIMPIRDDGLSDRDNVRGCAVFVIDPDASQILSMEGLARVFQLTRAEAEVATAIVNGDSLGIVAERRNVSIETARSQLKSVFRRTGASSQIELVRLAVKANPPIEKSPTAPGTPKID